eukprot:CAMPEP_0174377028 /NCGR_PEP_ID=MMETSP0811_2-20130205/120544_1 /TAXON_ID=73025 ORGANISM="Eutreptiella gymnastica-like, Strain CCMP1594" /NCGR_SAMPLE_ID=MMETSP0811_2 /ASSEMBLY_ACC=CAM_ASM_000667 /LENGTH=99 /DNA_ID=CAMNT_0015528861 /DNA_START=584 /DNA_END=879 /DNA_ORIENTATION=+
MSLSGWLNYFLHSVSMFGYCVDPSDTMLVWLIHGLKWSKHFNGMGVWEWESSSEQAAVCASLACNIPRALRMYTWANMRFLHSPQTIRPHPHRSARRKT